MAIKDIELTTLELKNLKQRGFYVKELNSFQKLTSNIIIQIILIFSSLGIGISIWRTAILLGLNLESQLFVILLLSTIPVFIKIFQSIIAFIFFGKLFYKESGRVIFRGISEVKDIIVPTISKEDGKINWFNLLRKPTWKIFGFNIGAIIFSIFWITGFMVFIYEIMLNGVSIFLPFILIYILAFFARQIIENINPIYIFGNLGSRIQSLAPTIEEKSREIEANFREDMDFRKLRSGFSELSSSLAKVSEYILKLEQAEKKANKGNLFDSVKYIGSLKGDIVKPLIALKGFLSTRLTELEKSKGDLSKVRVKVGGGEEALALQSTRTEPLMVELRSNIEKLDGMIEKL